MKTSLVNIAGAFTSYFLSGSAYWTEDGHLIVHESDDFTNYGTIYEITYDGRNKYSVTAESHDWDGNEYLTKKENLSPEEVIMFVVVGKFPD